MDILDEALLSVPIFLSEEQRRQLQGYFDLLVREAPALGLSGITDEREVAAKHLADSSFLAKAIQERAPQAQSALDLGSGAGVPGIVVRILCPQLERVVLLDSKAKAIQWTQGIAESLSIEGLEAIQGRAEELGQGTDREEYDVVMARAFGPLPLVLEYGIPLVRLGGTLVAMRGPVSDDCKSLDIAGLLGAEGGEEISYELPWRAGKRRLLLFRKRSSTPSRYPRGQGKAKKRPIVFHVKHYPNR